MILSHDFTVAAPANEAWGLLTDLERVAPCLPGAAITGHEGDEFYGTVKIKVGPIGANFKGTAQFVERDDSAYAAVILMTGKDTNGSASVRANLRAHLEPVDGSTTRVLLETDLDLKGRMAQFGRGAIADVSHRILGQFTDNLAHEVAGASSSTPAQDQSQATQDAGRSATQTAGSAFPRAAAPQQSLGTELNAMDLIAPMLRERVLPPLLGFVLGFLLSRAFPRR